MVWAGVSNLLTGTIHPVAHYSIAGNPALPPAEPGDALPIDAPPTTVASQEGRYYIVADNREEPATAPWKEGLLSYGFGSSAAFPLRSGEAVIGTMTFHAREPLFFDEEEVQLLVELTDNLSIALELMERERDITELKHVTDALQLSNRKLNLLNNIIRHDILNTVAGLLGLEDMALDLIPGKEAAELLQDMRNSTLKIQEQIVFTREYQDIGVTAPQWQAVRETVGRAGLQVELNGTRILHDEGNLEVFADPLLEKVFYNLMDNAIRYGETLTTIQFRWEETHDGLLLACEDDGAGVPDNEKEQIFKRGFGHNTGQGLFLVREILAITGITIRETGHLGGGARFELLVPPGAYRISGNKDGGGGHSLALPGTRPLPASQGETR